MKLFIDSNIFLSFYDFTGDDLAELDKLCLLIDDKRLDLLLPSQVIDETRRNRESTIGRSLRGFTKLPKPQIPSYFRRHGSYDAFKESQKARDKIHSQMLSDVRDQIENHELDADILIEKLFGLATRLDTTPDIVASAHHRITIGNPPGKGQSIRDAINWESLLCKVRSGRPLVLISGDGDYASPLNRDRLNTFLQTEWKERKSTDDLFYYRNLSGFFSKHHQDIKLKAETAKERHDLIDKLHQSGAFWVTHDVIARLSKHEFFSLGEAERLVAALDENSQVYLIIDDPDVHQFYGSIQSKYARDMSEESRQTLTRHLGETQAS
ncbi:MAG: PIN domain-containing protein [Gemmatimonadota bacterium]|nr:PIN domain-containing protein [Gemmatimonadota bacterium]